jgi:prepilin-type N-terminal cleavage/methylation domain-containing protein
MLRQRTGCARAGFTLMELLAVMAIMAVIMGSGIGAYFSMGKTPRIQGAARNLRTAISLARQQAIVKNSPIEMRFYKTGDDRYYYLLTNAVEGFAIGQKQFLPVGTRIGAPGVPWTLRFSANGRLDPLGPTIAIQDDSETVSVKVYGLTGLVRIQ